jgi:hypothetical protein
MLRHLGQFNQRERHSGIDRLKKAQLPFWTMLFSL